MPVLCLHNIGLGVIDRALAAGLLSDGNAPGMLTTSIATRPAALSTMCLLQLLRTRMIEAADLAI